MYMKVEISNGEATHDYYYDKGNVHHHGAGLAGKIVDKANEGGGHWQTASKPKSVNHCPRDYEQRRGDLGSLSVKLYCSETGAALLGFT